jgi:hypothetical protein
LVVDLLFVAADVADDLLLAELGVVLNNFLTIDFSLAYFIFK